MKTICFVLMSFSRYPVGGYKMVFEYANRLVKKGYKVKILFINDTAMKQFHIPEMIRKPLVNHFTQKYPQWINLDGRIEKVSTCEKNYKDKLQDVDEVFATAVETVETAQGASSNARKIYFIQGYENWNVDEQTLHATYSSGMKNVVIANWLKEVVDRYGREPAVVIQNPVDVKIYKPHIKNSSRPNHSLAFLYHESEKKGIKYTLEAIDILKKEYPDLQVKAFGMYKRPERLPEWIDYTEKASQEKVVEIYNAVQVFACATIEEGYGLTGLEAMACGTALATTRYQGVLEYATEENAMFSPIRDSAALAENIRKLFVDEQLRNKIANNGVITAQNYSWEIAVDKMIKVIEG